MITDHYPLYVNVHLYQPAIEKASGGISYLS